MRPTKLLVRSLVGLFLQRFCVVNLETRDGLIPAAGHHTMLSKLLIVPGAEHSVQSIVVNLCLLVLRPRGYMMLKLSHIVSE